MPHFIRMDDITGTSQQAGREDSILIIGWDLSNSLDSSGPKKGTFKEFTFEKDVDSASAGLHNSLEVGHVHPTAELEVTRFDSSGVESTYYKISFRDLVITSAQTSGSGDTVPTDQIIFEYGAIKIEYFPTR